VFWVGYFTSYLLCRLFTPGGYIKSLSVGGCRGSCSTSAKWQLVARVRPRPDIERDAESSAGAEQLFSSTSSLRSKHLQMLYQNSLCDGGYRDVGGTANIARQPRGCAICIEEGIKPTVDTIKVLDRLFWSRARGSAHSAMS
jgi:hypothetical protein